MKTTEIEVVEKTNSPIAMLKAAKEAGIDPKDIQGFLDVQINYEKREAEKEYNSAMARVHAKIPSVAKSALNPQTRSKYSELDQIVRAVKPIYTDEGFSVSFYEGDGAKDGNVRVSVDILHRLGHKETRHYDVPLDGVGIKGNANMTAIHGKASSVSYGRRYLMCMMFNIPTGDDNDGNNAAPSDCIDEKQAITINEFIDNLKVDKKKFLAFFKIETVEAMPKSRFQEAMVMLKTKEAKK